MIRVATLTFRARVFSLYIFVVSVILSILLLVNYFSTSRDVDSSENSTDSVSVVNFSVQNGDSLASLLKKYAVTDKEMSLIIAAMRKYYDPSKISIGQNISMFYETYTNDEEETVRYLNALKIAVTPTKSLEILRNTDNGFDAKEVPIVLERYLSHVTAEINSSLFSSAIEQEVPTSIINEVVKQLSYDIDFQREVRKGDRFSIVYETFYDQSGNFAMYGKPIYMSTITDDIEVKYYYFEHDDGTGEYYNRDGMSIKKDLLRTPINATRISSNFGLRKHPILGFTKMHNGVDFPAPIGTPIFAAGDGLVHESGRKGAYGNYVKIRHNGTYSTAYAHLSRFPKNIRPGAKVKQGDIIGYVGTTGRSTGPHLHYEVIRNGKHINPLVLKLAANKKLNGNSLRQFKEYVGNINSKLLAAPTRVELSAKAVKM